MNELINLEYLAKPISHSYDVWRIFCQLYPTKDCHPDIAKILTYNFFNVVKVSLFCDLVLSLCKIYDPPQIGNYKHITFESYKKIISMDPEINNTYNVAKNLMTSFRDLRNQIIAHYEYDFFLHPPGSDGFKQSDIDCILDYSRIVNNHIREHYKLTPYEYPIRRSKGAAEIILEILSRNIASPGSR
ncbi:MAG TPA: hypothetical protein PK014_13575 [Thermoanaerobaculia bacterium]|nr:hypothetical protein [Thermoanaerobaculia bacterium]HUM28504.1 hypothetical protein [Thermoanaerobaculia bacterium]HXK66888.1 hypothetical protein [Thermoanaerobaculia bacterium]